MPTKAKQPFDWRDHMSVTADADAGTPCVTVIDNKTGNVLRVWGALADELMGNLDALDRARAAA